MPIHEIPFEYIFLFIALFLFYIVARNVIERSKNSDNKPIVIDGNMTNNNFLNRKNIYLRNEYIKLHGDSRMAASEILDRQIALLRKKHPDRTLEWYIEKAIYDLQRDRHLF